MTTLYPFLFEPIFKERVWGGRNLERLYHKSLPAAVPIGESWEITDRPEGVSVIANGPLAGKNLRWLMENHAQELLGADARHGGRFPLLIKLLDAEEKLSVQVHPAAESAKLLGGEPKTEMWYIVEAKPQAELYAGLRKGVTREEFEKRIADGTVAECIHRLPVTAGDVLFLPSGRVHAIGAGLVIFEIQQNSDTTYRVFDWNRVGLDGKPRDLHLKESLASIDFEDHEPRLTNSVYSRNPTLAVRYLVDKPPFKVDACKVKRGGRFYLRSDGFQILAIVKGKLALEYKEMKVTLEAGQFCLLPAALERVTVTTETQVDFLQIQTGSALQ
jgi:mannose-6-phosphate isomerase